MTKEDILNSYCALGNYWETCKRYYDEAGCDNCRYLINRKIEQRIYTRSRETIKNNKQHELDRKTTW